MNQDQITRNFMIVNTQLARIQKLIDVGMDKRIRALEDKVDELTAQLEAKRGPGRPRKDAEAA